MKEDHKKLFIVDAANYLFRSYFAIRNMSNKKGVSTGALFGFIRSIQKIIKDFAPEYFVCVFDGPENKKSRTDIYKEYKSHRTGMPEDLFAQLDLAKEYCKCQGIQTEEISGIEADDAIGSIARWAEKHKMNVYLCSSDKDLCQLVSDNVHIIQTHKDNLEVDPGKVEEIYGVTPSQIIDYLALIGDASDNIPGVKGIGPKTAARLLSEYKSLKSLYENIDTLESGGLKERLLGDYDNALMSYELATINTHIKIPETLDHYHLRKPDTICLQKLFEEMNFVSLLKELGARETVHETTREYITLETESAIEHFVVKALEKPHIAIDTETTSLNFIDAEIVGIGFSYAQEEAFYIPCNHKLSLSKVLSLLKPLFASDTIRWIGHNLKYDIHVLQSASVRLKNIFFDTMIASYLLHSEENRHNIDTLAYTHFNHKKIPITDLQPKGTKEIDMSRVPLEKIAAYCCEDADYTFRLFALFSQKLKEEKLDALFYNLEMPLIPILVDMEHTGIYLDPEKLQKIGKELHAKLAEQEKRIYKEAGHKFNINSTKQLSTVLYQTLNIAPLGKKTTHGFSTDQDALQKIRDKHPIVEFILTYRQLEKLRSTYVDTLIEQINPKTHRIHTSYNQSVTATGRLSSNNPNLQNIPIRSEEGKKIRSCFMPDKRGWSFAAFDYSQIELRILAHLSQDPHLIAAFVHDEDIHASVASKIFEVPLEKVTHDMRAKAKAVNFGLMYGQGAFGLSNMLGITTHEAKNFIDTYFKKYEKVKVYLEKLKDEARQHGYAISMFGRKRYIPDILSKNGPLRAAAERLAINSPMQGAQSDLIKIAMVGVSKKLKPEEAVLLLQIHDELVFCIKDSELDRYKKMIQHEMQEVASVSVPLKVDVSVGKNWGEC